MASKELTYQSVEGPFKVYDKRKPELKEPINTVEEFKKSVLKAIQKWNGPNQSLQPRIQCALSNWYQSCSRGVS